MFVGGFFTRRCVCDNCCWNLKGIAEISFNLCGHKKAFKVGVHTVGEPTGCDSFKKIKQPKFKDKVRNELDNLRDSLNEHIHLDE